MEEIDDLKGGADTCDRVEIENYQSGMLHALSYFPNLRQSLILCGLPTLSASNVDTLSKSLFRC